MTQAGFDLVEAEPGSLRRSVELFRAFRVEQTDPDRFYRALAADAVGQVAQHAGLADATVVDVGGGPGYFRDAFAAAGARYVGVDVDLGEMSGLGPPQGSVILGSGMSLPLASGSVDVAFSSNVLEHVVRPEVMADEMVRVTRPGGLVWLSYTLWLSPWGGHETSPWHYLGGERAARRYRRKTGHDAKNRYGSTLFPLSARRMLRWLERRPDVTPLFVGPRYHPRWARWVIDVPGVREFASWNLLLVLRRH